MSEAVPPGLSRETTLHRDASGRWFHDGEPVSHPAVIRAFHRWLERAEDGRLRLRNAVNWAYVTVEGAPLFADRIRFEAEAAQMQLSGGDTAPLDPSTLRQGPDGRLYATTRDLAVELRRAAVLDLAEQVGEDEQGLFVEVGGERVHPPVVDDPVAYPPG